MSGRPYQLAKSRFKPDPVRGPVSSSLDKTQESNQVTLSGTCSKAGSQARSRHITLGSDWVGLARLKTIHFKISNVETYYFNPNA